MKVKPRCTTIIRKARIAHVTLKLKVELLNIGKTTHIGNINTDEQMTIATVDL